MDIGDINIDDLTMDIDQIIEHASSIIPTFVAIDDCIKVNFETEEEAHIENIDIQNTMETIKDLAGQDIDQNTISYSSEDGDPQIVADNQFFGIQFNANSTLMDDSDEVKLVKVAEKLVRKSFEYSHYLGYLKNDLGMTICSVMPQVNSEVASLEMHHYPFTLFELCLIVLKKQQAKDEDITSFSIADEVLELHYQHRVGLVPLSKTVHDLVHAGKIFIRLQQAFGDILSFTREYKDYIPEDTIIQLFKIIELSKKNASILDSKNMLQLKSFAGDQYEQDLTSAKIDMYSTVVMKSESRD